MNYHNASISPRDFTYAAQKGPYVSTVCAFLFISLAESTLIVFLVLRFVPGIILQALILGLLALFLMLMGGKLLAPLWTRHSVSETTLRLRFGFDFRTELPRSALISARPVKEQIGPLPRVAYNPRQGYLSLAFSRQGQFLLRLDSPRTLRFGWRGVCTTDTLLISVDQREALLKILALPEHASSSVASDAAKVTSTIPQEEEATVSLLGTREREARNKIEIGPLTLRAVGLTRRYGERVIVDRLNLSVHAGEIYGFLGPNGAGKSTTIKMLVGLLQPTAGQAFLAGHDMWREPLLAKGALGYVADRALLYDRLTGREFLAFLAQLRGLPRPLAERRTAELLDLLELTPEAGRLCGAYSFGMKRKLALAGALLHQPPVLILDEPLNGLDPLSARRLKDLFLQLSSQGTTIFLSTHDLATAETICHRVGIIQRGRLLVEGSAAELRSLAAAPDLESVFLALTSQREEVLA